VGRVQNAPSVEQTPVESGIETPVLETPVPVA